MIQNCLILLNKERKRQDDLGAYSPASVPVLLLPGCLLISSTINAPCDITNTAASSPLHKKSRVSAPMAPWDEASEFSNDTGYLSDPAYRPIDADGHVRIILRGGVLMGNQFGEEQTLTNSDGHV